MRTTIRLDDQLLKEVRQLAILHNQTLTAVIENALRETVARQKQTGQRQPVRLTLFTGQGLQPGADLDDMAALLDFMETADDSD